MVQSWTQKVEDYCNKYNIPTFYLAETLYEPKVVPMIRGKAFEFSTLIKLQELLPDSEWVVDKPMMNAQLGLHDIDVRVHHKATGKTIRIECKLAKKGGFRTYPDGHTEIRVKCMRSRTLGPAKVKELAPKFGVSEEVLAIHNDQYLPADYDVVVTSIANAFYNTDSSTGYFEWKPSKSSVEFLNKLAGQSIAEGDLQEFAFNTMFFAKTTDIAINNNGVKCTRGQCTNKDACGFIPNYPIIFFDKDKYIPANKWYPITDCVEFFNKIIEQS